MVCPRGGGGCAPSVEREVATVGVGNGGWRVERRGAALPIRGIERRGAGCVPARAIPRIEYRIASHHPIRVVDFGAAVWCGGCQGRPGFVPPLAPRRRDVAAVPVTSARKQSPDSGASSRTGPTF